jgi:hypothetical protein
LEIPNARNGRVNSEQHYKHQMYRITLDKSALIGSKETLAANRPGG